jgi:hypothetical protein
MDKAQPTVTTLGSLARWHRSSNTDGIDDGSNTAVTIVAVFQHNRAFACFLRLSLLCAV